MKSRSLYLGSRDPCDESPYWVCWSRDSSQRRSSVRIRCSNHAVWKIIKTKTIPITRNISPPFESRAALTNCYLLSSHIGIVRNRLPCALWLLTWALITTKQAKGQELMAKSCFLCL